ncbi:hypothetical protein KM043_015086 [Ampulex compressa]|nr:hypothetical protein KM043_015086 [Ampulex compressa]
MVGEQQVNARLCPILVSSTEKEIVANAKESFCSISGGKTCPAATCRQLVRVSRRTVRPSSAAPKRLLHHRSLQPLCALDVFRTFPNRSIAKCCAPSSLSVFLLERFYHRLGRFESRHPLVDNRSLAVISEASA